MTTKLNNATSKASAAIRPGHVEAARTACEAVATAGASLLALCAFSMAQGAPTQPELTAGGWSDSSAKTMASQLLQCDKLAKIIGAARAEKILRDGAADKVTSNRSYDSAIDAVRAALALAKADNVTSASAAVANRISKAVPAKLAEKAKESAARRAVKHGAKSGKVAEKSADLTPAASWRGLTTQALQLAHAAHAEIGAAMPEGKEALCRKFAKALADAAELGAMIGKPERKLRKS